MKRITAIAILTGFLVLGSMEIKAATPTSEPISVVNDFMCGLHRVQINDYSGLMVDSQPYGDYKTTMLDTGNNYVHQFGDKAELRVTPYGRVAFRLAGETRWAACTPLVFHEVAQ